MPAALSALSLLPSPRLLATRTFTPTPVPIPIATINICSGKARVSALSANSPLSCIFDTSVYTTGTENQVSKVCSGKTPGDCPLESVTCEPGYDESDLECVPHAYRVSYSCGTGSGNAPGGTSQQYGGTYQIATNTCSKPGYNFTGWSDGSGIRQPGQITWTYTKDIVFTAQWEPCENNPTTGQGTCGCGSNSYPNGSGCANCSVSCASVPTYNLGTYNVCESETDNECYRNCTTSDVANSTVVSGTVTKGGTRSCKATSCAEDFYLSGNGCAACVPNATCPGGGESFECNTGYHLSDDETSCEPDEYSITLKKNGGSGTINGSTGVNDAVQQCKHGELCNLPSSGITRNGYAFTGWGDSSACTSGVYQKVFTGAETLYACWSQQTTQCQSGKYYNGTDHVNCPSGSYCPGTGNANIGQAGCSVSCPSGADGSDTGATSASGCYKTCGGKTITGGTATVVSAKVYYSGSAYPACTYHVTCNEGYRATNQDTAAATCTPCEDGQVCPGGDGTDDPDDCPPGSYCEGGIEHECPVGGTSDAGAGAITDCYRVCEPTLDIDNGQGISLIMVKVFQLVTNTIMAMRIQHVHIVQNVMKTMCRKTAQVKIRRAYGVILMNVQKIITVHQTAAVQSHVQMVEKPTVVQHL